MTPLHYASLGGFSGVVEELLCNGATPTVGDKVSIINFQSIKLNNNITVISNIFLFSITVTNS